MELLERFTTGDVEAFEMLFQQYQKNVYGWILRIVRNPIVAEELTVETFWRIYRSRSRFDPTRNFGAWTRRIATNLALDYLKRVGNEVEFTENISPESQPDLVLQHDTRKRIQQAFSQLPPKLRLTATLALVEEIPYQEIAESLGIPVGTVKSRVFTATRFLRSKLRELGADYE
ncbi:MAG: sigma-70 family RNA polymerase sigma factor [Pyrinomonadaceae bacterium]